MWQDDEDDIWDSAPRPRPSAKAAPSGPAAVQNLPPVKAYLVEQRVGGGRRLALPPTGHFILNTVEGGDFRVQDSSVGEGEAVIQAARRRFFVEALGPAEVYVNEEPVRSSRRLEDGDRLRVGEITFLVQYV